MSRLAIAAAALAAALAPAGGWADAFPVCATVEGAPAATSASLVEGMLREMRAGNRTALKQYLDTGQALFLRGGKRAELLARDRARGLVQFRREVGQLPLWTAERGLACGGEGAGS